jgi:PRTRC genetic system ThiF family protein
MIHPSPYATAIPLLVPEYRQLQVFLVGVGGTGSWLLPPLCRLLMSLNVETALTLVDPDRVEPSNLIRQNFYTPDIDRFKARVLAARYGLSHGMEIEAFAEPFSPSMLGSTWNSLTVLVGCVDNPAARRVLSRALKDNSGCLWLDCGNHGNGIGAGQVLLGNKVDFERRRAFKPLDRPVFCAALPSPCVQHPELLEEEPAQTPGCRENAQAPFINQRVAVEAVLMLDELLRQKNCRRFATYFHTPSGSCRSLYITPEALARYPSANARAA